MGRTKARKASGVRAGFSPFAKELLGVAVLGVMVFMLLSLLTFDPKDSHLFSPRNLKVVHNIMGITGATLAKGALKTLGLAAYVVPLVLCICSWILFAGFEGKYNPLRFAAFPVFLVSLSGILSLALQGREITAAGGMLGKEVAGAASPFLNVPGTYLLFAVILAISLSVMTSLSFVSIMRGIKNAAAASYETLSSFVAVRVERARREKEKQRKAEDSQRAKELARMEKDKEGEEKQASEKKQEEASKAPPQPPGNGKSQAQQPSTFVPPAIVTSPPPMDEDTFEPLSRKESQKGGRKEKQIQFEFLDFKGEYKKPSLSFLDADDRIEQEIDKEALISNAETLEKRLLDYGIPGKVTSVSPGPVITRYEFEPAPGVKVGKIMALTDDLSLAMRALSVRILAPVPGKPVVGIEIPNARREMVYLKDIIGSEEFVKSKITLSLALGKDIAGNPFITELPQMPHLLIAGATGSGKSVAVNSMICSILYKADPDEVKFIMIDPKLLELSLYEGIPHLMLPVVTDMRKAAQSLRWAVEEMEARYRLLAEKGVRNIETFNKKVEEDIKALEGKGMNIEKMKALGEKVPEKMRYIVLIIDELADLMMVAGKDVEEAITRLAQMARASGIHLLVATQRPSVDVLTGVIKANFPARIAFKVATKVDSRTILDQNGAERLLGKGDMLFLSPGTSKIIRVHGAFISETEIKRIVNFLKQQGNPVYDESIIRHAARGNEDEYEPDNFDEKYDDALQYVSQLGHASISLIQRRFRVGYNRAARIIEKMEKEGILAPSDGSSKPRVVLVNKLR